LHINKESYYCLLQIAFGNEEGASDILNKLFLAMHVVVIKDDIQYFG
jgi:hypothetical protein